MALNIRHDETERLAADLARLTGETKTEAVRRAVQDRLDRLQREQRGLDPVADLDEIALRCARLPVRDERTAEEIIGYDEHGVPG
jgi:antitoxin VapB